MSILRRRPVTFGLLSLLIAIYLIEIGQSQPGFWILGQGQLPPIAAAGAVWTPAIAAGEWWRLVTAGVLHGSLIHLVLNSCALLVIGTAAEHRFGSWRTLAVFVAAVVGGNAAAAFFDRGAPSLGASGGIMGLAGAVLVATYRTREGFERSQWILSAVVATIFYGFLHAGISNSAHIGGLLVGSLVAWPLRISEEYASAALALRERRERAIEDVAAKLAELPVTGDADPGIVLRPSWSYPLIALAGLALFGSPLVIDYFNPGAPLFLLIVCVAFVAVFMGMLLTVPRVNLRLTDNGFAYTPPFWWPTVSANWEAVTDVSVYSVSTGYGTQRFARLAFVAQGRDGPREKRLLLTRLGNLKPKELVRLIEEYRSRTNRL
ncbi:MAG: rhomboid family intramembrane serine protease [Actinobacteria bacterium]|nr:rhomboid family intramembrane serine protease [Actinomycetota bacterium]